MVNQEELLRALPVFLHEFAGEIVSSCVDQQYFPGEERVAAMTLILLEAVLEDYRLRGLEPDEAVDWLWHGGYQKMEMSRQITRRIVEAMHRADLTADPDGRAYWFRISKVV